ncbi:Uncharacterised protein [Enterobacter hormaechei]|nr:hypothetical protein L369_03140 [Enterobacter sp. MGH 23]EUL40874.1 hypothetical protein P852_02703 [Enterobacter asburiae]CAF2462858.1 hypothetical protein AI2839V1_2955 [Enterobacter cloacae]CZY32400.1 Uncharacterised protein [Enterobacter hormaechei]SAP70465.1 Uncharacterised protein [Klebsiella michiganensis]VUM38111.1 Uncharacterised protein [Klebsiella pneumoniae]BBV65359.1 hypothetical protein STW0522KLE44_17470 [Klebsiella sp. STW0522-44]
MIMIQYQNSARLEICVSTRDSPMMCSLIFYLNKMNSNDY